MKLSRKVLYPLLLNGGVVAAAASYGDTGGIAMWKPPARPGIDAVAIAAIDIASDEPNSLIGDNPLYILVSPEWLNEAIEWASGRREQKDGEPEVSWWVDVCDIAARVIAGSLGLCDGILFKACLNEFNMALDALQEITEEETTDE